MRPLLPGGTSIQHTGSIKIWWDAADFFIVLTFSLFVFQNTTWWHCKEGANQSWIFFRCLELYDIKFIFSLKCIWILDCIWVTWIRFYCETKPRWLKNTRQQEEFAVAFKQRLNCTGSRDAGRIVGIIPIEFYIGIIPIEFYNGAGRLYFF